MTNLIEEMKDIFELANNVTSFIKNVKESIKKENSENNEASSGNCSQLASSGDDSKLASSGYDSKLASSGYDSNLASSGNYSKLASSGNYSKLASSGDESKLAGSGYDSKLASSGYDSKLASSGNYSKLASSGDESKLASSGNYSKLASSGNCSQLASSGDESKLASSGNYSKLASSGNYSKLASSGNCSQLASSGNYSKLASSGNCSQLASSGDDSQSECTGEKSVIASIGAFSIAKSKIGSWITLAEYKDVGNHYEVDFVKTEYVDGKNIKEDIFYTLCNHEFKEYGEFDGIKCAILSHKKDVYKVKNFGEKETSYVIEKDGVFSHGKTIKEAKESFIYKISNRDTYAYQNLKLDSEVTFEEAVKMYRVITGSCEAGTKYFVSQLAEVKKKYTIAEIIKLTEGQYGSNSFKKFFDDK